MSESYIGQIILVPYDFAPRGWAFCQGQPMSIQQNSALFSLLGTTYGGDGKTTFNLPDLRGRAPIGAGQGSGLNFYKLAEAQGSETVALSVDQMPAHAHAIQAVDNDPGVTSPNGAYLAAPSQAAYATDDPTVSMGNKMVASTGKNFPHPNMPPYLALNYVICLQGIYPSKN